MEASWPYALGSYALGETVESFPLYRLLDIAVPH